MVYIWLCDTYERTSSPANANTKMILVTNSTTYTRRTSVGAGRVRSITRPIIRCATGNSSGGWTVASWNEFVATGSDIRTRTSVTTLQAILVYTGATVAAADCVPMRPMYLVTGSSDHPASNTSTPPRVWHRRANTRRDLPTTSVRPLEQNTPAYSRLRPTPPPLGLLLKDNNQPARKIPGTTEFFTTVIIVGLRSHKSTRLVPVLRRPLCWIVRSAVYSPPTI